jgi:hypothetical protein
VPVDRGVEPGLALIEAEGVLAELERFLDRPAQPYPRTAVTTVNTRPKPPKASATNYLTGPRYFMDDGSGLRT